ncbi:MAG: hypothetical protein COX06_01945 [Candidatus Zambryskibacteria bacterium CG22_combo_CG10-13_8_21_14_all_42_17]|uniref:Response regulatory domain-containing protein n=1 Tax=Candidatus Zambryskibacteria bacterium CG22_combo_CG10-13_8_21_14_all_42_17 TaxID=1975118 RepID=A0A2H0BDG3_9BACT|nr:MAG: hypothetical protein COX06_01945 [Candidatus Zambryskibacteria bacterium CG22_combo_CG10-13_8_21_14_all_42_17]
MRVLIVEDDKDIQFVIREVFNDAGCDVLVASDGEEAWELLQKGEKFDKILSDQSMPRMNGLELLQKVRSSDITASVEFVLMSSGLVVSESDQTPIRIACKRLGILFLEKPFPYGALRFLCTEKEGNN